LKELEKKCDQQANEIKNLKEKTKEQKEIIQVPLMYGSPSSQYQKKKNGEERERLSAYQDKKMRFEKSTDSLNRLKFSSASKKK